MPTARARGATGTATTSGTVATDEDKARERMASEDETARRSRGVSAKQLRVLVLIVVWMCISISLIMYNKWLLSYKGYRFPLAMTMTHQACTATLAHVTCRLGFMSPPALTFDQFRTRIVPIALLFSASIALSNFAVSYLTVPFMQMLKASIPTFSLLISFSTGVEQFDLRLLGTVVGIGVGVMIASLGEIDFVMTGFVIAVVGLVTEAARLVLTQRLLQGQDIKFNAITGNFYTAPIAFVALGIPFVLFELPRYRAEVDLGEMWGFVLSNGALAAMLNVSVFVVLKETSAVTYGIAGQVKDWLNILLAIPIFHNTVSPLQFFGYSIAVTGVFYYKKLRTKIGEQRKRELELARRQQQEQEDEARKPLVGEQGN